MRSTLICGRSPDIHTAISASVAALANAGEEFVLFDSKLTKQQATVS